MYDKTTDYTAIATYALRESLRRGFPVSYRIKGEMILLKYKNVTLPYQVRGLLSPNPDDVWISITLSYQGQNVIIAEINRSDRSYNLRPENVPFALRLVEGAISQHTADTWHIRLREYPKAINIEQLDKGFIVKWLELTRDIIVEKDSMVFAWVNTLTTRPDVCYREQIENEIRMWSEEEIEFAMDYISKKLM